MLALAASSVVEMRVVMVMWRQHSGSSLGSCTVTVQVELVEKTWMGWEWCQEWGKQRRQMEEPGSHSERKMVEMR